MIEPTLPGIYAAEVYYGWKLLEFRDRQWWHQGRVGRWPDGLEPLQWVGPLPERVGGKPKVYDL